SPDVATLRISAGVPGSFSAVLAERLRGTMRGVRIELTPTDSYQGMAALEGRRTDLAVATADEPYFRFVASQRDGAPPSRRLCAIAALPLVPVQVVAAGGARVAHIPDLAGRGAWIGSQPVIPLLLRAFDVDPGGIRRPVADVRDVAAGLEQSSLQAAVIIT